MSSDDQKVTLKGREKAAVKGSRVIASADPHEVIQVTVRLRPRTSIDRNTIEKNGTLPVQERSHLTHEQYEQQHGANPNDIAKVEEFAHEHDLSVAQADVARRTVILTGTVAAFTQAFDVDLKQYEHDGTRFRGRTGAVHIPESLSGVVIGVLGLDNRPAAKPHSRRLVDSAGVQAHATGSVFTPVQVARAYNFPNTLDGSGETVAIIELGGGYRTGDLKTYFKKMGIPEPKITSVSVDGGHNHADGNPGGPDGEVMLDIEVAGAVSPGAKYVVYFAPNTDAGFLDAITTAVHDKVRNPSVISISWGGPEASWTQQSLQAYDEAFQAAAALGVTVFAASGDNGSTDGMTDGKQHVDFPASDPFVVGCGGTNLQIQNGKPVQKVWNNGTNGGATGGGISDVFPLPDYQKKNANIKKSVNDNGVRRGVPDISGDADPQTGYEVLVDGQSTVYGGTSAVAPLFAGLMAKVNQNGKQRVGFINPLLYQNTGAMTDVTAGDNGAYKAGPGWDACTGLGVPDGSKLIGVLTSKPKKNAAEARAETARAS
jgi:kumamolisin